MKAVSRDQLQELAGCCCLPRVPAGVPAGALGSSPTACNRGFATRVSVPSSLRVSAQIQTFLQKRQLLEIWKCRAVGGLL